MAPALGVSKPPIRRSRGVFPQPEGPSKVKNSLPSIAMLTSFNAETVSAPLVTKVLETPRNSIIVGVSSRFTARYVWRAPFERRIFSEASQLDYICQLKIYF